MVKIYLTRDHRLWLEVKNFKIQDGLKTTRDVYYELCYKVKSALPEEEVNRAEIRKILCDIAIDWSDVVFQDFDELALLVKRLYARRPL